MKTSNNAYTKTGIKNLDAILGGGFPKNTVTLVAGTPGAGKTILSQQISFHNASPDCRVLFFQTLSEPTVKTLRYLKAFDFFDPKQIEKTVFFYDLGTIMRKKGLEDAAAMIVEQIAKIKPSIVVIDSFKVFEDLAGNREELRKFTYEVAIHLMAWECTAFLLGEFSQLDLARNPLSSIVDGMIMVTTREISGEEQRFVQVSKMRGTDHSRDQHPFIISSGGIEVYCPRVTMRRDSNPDSLRGPVDRCKTGITELDQMLGEGIPRGSSMMLSGAAGTGKTVLSLELLYRGAKEHGEKGIFFSFEETNERLLAAARGLGWDLEEQIKKGMIEFVFIPQPDVFVEKHLQMISDRIDRLQAKRVVLDSLSVFLHKVKDDQIAREKTFQLGTLVQKAGAVGFFAVDVPFGSGRISRFGVEETVLDGIILLNSVRSSKGRNRYLEVYKLRNTAHLEGRYPMRIANGGIQIDHKPKSKKGRP